MVSDFWTPEFNITHRPDGTILMANADPLMGYLPTLADYLDKWAADTPDTIFLGCRDEQGQWETITYAEALHQTRCVASALLALGLCADRPLVILSKNSLAHAVMGLACLYVGIPYAPVSPAYSLLSQDHKKLKDIAQLLLPGAVFADDGAAFAPAILAAFPSECQVMNVTPGQPNALQYQDLLNYDPKGADAARAAICADDVVKYLFTSGSTGAPKAVINTNGMICAMQAMVRDCYRYLEKEPPVVLDWAPWNHTAAGNKVFYLALTNGGSYYIDHGRPVPEQIDQTLRNMKEIACTWYFNVPIGWDLLVPELERDANLAATFFSKLGMMFYAGAGLSQQTWDRLQAIARKTTGRDVLLATSLGATETAPFALACTQIQDKSGNVGVPARGLSMKLVPHGGTLELRLKGPSITPGYYKNLEKTAEAFDEEGYYCMGDALRPADPEDLTQGFFFDGRLAENFKLSTGTWVSVGALRTSLVNTMQGLVRDVVIVGENRPELGALLLLSQTGKSLSPTERDQRIAALLSDAAQRATGSASRVTRATVLPQEPSFDRGEVTEKGSLNQRAMRRAHEQIIEALYRGAGEVYLAKF